jgi:hypothetical protein
MVRVTRDGDIIGSFSVRSSSGGYEVTSGLVCAGSGITAKDAGVVGTTG